MFVPCLPDDTAADGTCPGGQFAGAAQWLGKKTQPQAQEPLGQSLDEVIKSLENDQQRTQLLTDLKKLRDVTQKAQPTTEEGVLGLIGGTLAGFEKQFFRRR